MSPSHRVGRFVGKAAALLAAAVLVTAMTAPSASADVTVQVSTAQDESVADSQCSLREALGYAGGFAQPDCASGPAVGVVTIVVPPGCYRLASILLVSQKAGSLVTRVVIMGSGAGPAGCGGGGTVIDGRRTGSLFEVAPVIVMTVSGVTLTGGLSCSFSGCDGGAIVNGGTLSLNGVTITGNEASAGADQSTPGTGGAGGAGHNGGGIYNSPTGQLTVTDSEIVGNAAGAGGAGADGSGNNGGPGGAGGSGGGIYNVGGIVNVINSTVSGNAAGAGGTGGLGDPTASPSTAGGPGGTGGDGGGIASVPDVSSGSAGRLTVRNSTVAGNFAGSGGGGGMGSPRGASGAAGGGGGIRAIDAALLSNVTVAGNSAAGTGDGVDAAGGALTEYGSVIAANGSGAGAQNCVGAITDDAYNVTYPSQAFSDCPGIAADPRLGPLALRGGGLFTVPLRSGSAAIDIEPPGGACPASDERGIARPQNARCDAGAYESAPPQITNATAAAAGPTTASVSASVDAHLQDTSVVVRYGRTTAYGGSSHTVDAGAGTGPRPVTVPLSGLAPSATYHIELDATNADGTVTSTEMTVTTPADSPTGGGGGAGAPIISSARQSARRWLPGRTLATLTRRHALQVGTTFTFGLDQTATVTLTFTRLVSGRVVKRHCLAPSTRNQHRSRCTRALVAGTLAFAAHAGANQIHFYGRLSRRAQLTPGNYAVDIGAINPAGQRSAPQRLSFTIVNP